LKASQRLTANANTVLFGIAGDVDGDGVEDIAYASNNNVVIHFARGGGSFEPPVYLSLPGILMGSIAFFDMDVDGKPDIAVGSTGGTELSVFHSLGQRMFDAQKTYPGGQ
jgi:FG-GAP-like repeat